MLERGDLGALADAVEALVRNTPAAGSRPATTGSAYGYGHGSGGGGLAGAYGRSGGLYGVRQQQQQQRGRGPFAGGGGAAGVLWGGGAPGGGAGVVPPRAASLSLDMLELGLNLAKGSPASLFGNSGRSGGGTLKRSNSNNAATAAGAGGGAGGGGAGSTLGGLSASLSFSSSLSPTEWRALSLPSLGGGGGGNSTGGAVGTAPSNWPGLRWVGRPMQLAVCPKKYPFPLPMMRDWPGL